MPGLRGRLGPLHHRGLLLPPQKGESQGGDHKYDGSRGRQLRQERSRARAAEHRLAGPTESRADTRALAVLQQHDKDQGKADQNMNDYDNCAHINF